MNNLIYWLAFVGGLSILMFIGYCLNCFADRLCEVGDNRHKINYNEKRMDIWKDDHLKLHNKVLKLEDRIKSLEDKLKKKGVKK